MSLEALPPSHRRYAPRERGHQRARGAASARVRGRPGRRLVRGDRPAAQPDRLRPGRPALRHRALVPPHDTHRRSGRRDVGRRHPPWSSAPVPATIASRPRLPVAERRGRRDRRRRRRGHRPAERGARAVLQARDHAAAPQARAAGRLRRARGVPGAGGRGRRAGSAVAAPTTTCARSASPLRRRTSRSRSSRPSPPTSRSSRPRPRTSWRRPTRQRSRRSTSSRSPSPRPRWRRSPRRRRPPRTSTLTTRSTCTRPTRRSPRSRRRRCGRGRRRAAGDPRAPGRRR